MQSSKSVYAKLVGVGSYVPDKVLTNKDLEKIVDTSDEWIKTRTGIRERHISSNDEATSDLALKASLRAMENANISSDKIELIIVATVTPNMLFPSTACFLQKELRAFNAVAFDLSAACSGFVYAVSVASSLIESGRYSNVLVVGAEVLSKFVNWKDRSTCILFGDGAGAAILSATDKQEGVLYSCLHSDSSYTDLLYLPGGGSLYPANKKTLDDELHTIKMKGNEVFKIAVNTMVDSAQKVLNEYGIEAKDLKMIIPHQANHRIISAVRKRLNVSSDCVYSNVDRFGNTSAATIPIALDEVIVSQKVTKGDLVLCVAFGAGFTSGSLLLKI